MRSAVLTLPIAWITAWGRVLVVMSGSPLLASTRTLATGTLPSTRPRRAGVDRSSSPCAGAGSAAAVMVMMGNPSALHCPRTIAALSRDSCLWKKRAMLSRHLDACVHARDRREVGRQGAQRSYAVAELASPLWQVDAQELHHVVRDGAVEACEGYLPVP